MNHAHAAAGRSIKNAVVDKRSLNARASVIKTGTGILLVRVLMDMGFQFFKDLL